MDEQESKSPLGKLAVVVGTLAAIVGIFAGLKELGVFGTDEPLRGVRITDTSPTTFRGECPTEFDYTAEISADTGSGTVKYQLVFPSFSSPERQEHVEASGTRVSEPLRARGSDSVTVQWRVLEPESAESDPRQVEVICE